MASFHISMSFSRATLCAENSRRSAEVTRDKAGKPAGLGIGAASRTRTNKKVPRPSQESAAEPARGIKRPLIERAIAWHIQAKTFGGLSAAQRRILRSAVPRSPVAGGNDRAPSISRPATAARKHVLAPGFGWFATGMGEPMWWT